MYAHTRIFKLNKNDILWIYFLLFLSIIFIKKANEGPADDLHSLVEDAGDEERDLSPDVSMTDAREEVPCKVCDCAPFL